MTAHGPEITDHHRVRVDKFWRMLEYLRRVGLDPEPIARTAGLECGSLEAAPKDHTLHAVYYASLYEAAADAMQQISRAIPWAGGVGTDAFRFMCYSIIACPTLGEALERAASYYRLVYPVTACGVELAIEGETAHLCYSVDISVSEAVFAPRDWQRTANIDAVANSSGLTAWYGLLGWLIGRNVELHSVQVAAPFLSREYQESLEELFGVPVRFDASRTALAFDRAYLDYQLVHTPETLEAFLRNAVYYLIAQEGRPVSTSDAIKSLLIRNFSGTPPSFETMADYLHMSKSSLRRRLQKENTSYQALKDEHRSELAMWYLRDPSMRVNDISELLGFREPGSFIRSFRSWTGLTPKQFRENSRG